MKVLYMIDSLTLGYALDQQMEAFRMFKDAGMTDQKVKLYLPLNAPDESPDTLRATMARDVDASELAPASHERSPLAQLEHTDLKSIIRRALAELPETLRTAVMLRDLQEYSYQEIADQLGLPEGTVKSRINRGRIELARQIRRIQEAAPAARLLAKPARGGTA